MHSEHGVDKVCQYDPNHFDFVLSDDSSEWYSPKANRTHSLSSTMAQINN